MHRTHREVASVARVDRPEFYITLCDGRKALIRTRVWRSDEFRDQDAS
jgi:hypothetical protein